MLYATGYVTGYVCFIAYASCLKILKSSICHAGTQNMLPYDTKSYNLLPRYLLIPLGGWLQQMGPRKKFFKKALTDHDRL